MKLIIIMLTTLASTLLANTVTDKLYHQMEIQNSLVCVGLDPDLSKFPNEILQLPLSDEEKIFQFISTVVDLTADHICAFKLQKAFYDPFESGHKLLIDVVNYIKKTNPGIPIFIDCKIGDTENTMSINIHNLFTLIKADGIVVNPYMGDDVFSEFQKNPNITALVLCQTSNPNAKIIQESVLNSGEFLWQKILHLTLSRWNTQNNMILILSSNTPNYDYKKLRNQIPNNVPILLAGIGAQGGNLSVLKDLLNDQNIGVFVGSSRDILYPYTKESADWKNKIQEATIALKNQINGYRNELN